MARVIAALIRHGDYQQLIDTPSAHQPFPLNTRGVDQAAELAPMLAEFCLQQQCQINPQIASSRLLRAWQTARELIVNLGTATHKIKEHEELAERSVGSAANLSIAQITDIIHLDPRFDDLPKNWKSDSEFCLPFQGAESLIDAGKRLATFLSSEMQLLQSQFQSNSQIDQLKIFIGHGAVFRHAAYHLGVLEYAQIKQLSMFHCQPVFIEYQADGRWQHVGGAWKVRNVSSQYAD